MANSTLNAIRTKVRRLTRSPSESQLSTAELDEYINTFVVYDFPAQLRTFNLKSTFTFWTNPYQDTYATDEITYGQATGNPLYNFKNKYMTIHPPVYVAGFQSLYSQSREQFFGIYPFVNSIASTQLFGNGITQVFSGVINAAQSFTLAGQQNQKVGLLQRNVTLTAINTNGQSMSMVDSPTINNALGANGYLFTDGTLVDPTAGPVPFVSSPPANPNNFIDYATGAFTVTFPQPPASGQPIMSETSPQIQSRPQGILYYNDMFTIRPIPDMAYPINFEVYARPVDLIANNQTPQLEQWWQYLAIGAARKVLQDRMDMETVALIDPEFREQEALCLRTTIVQLTNQRTATIYTEQTSFGPNWGG